MARFVLFEIVERILAQQEEGMEIRRSIQPRNRVVDGTEIICPKTNFQPSVCRVSKLSSRGGKWETAAGKMLVLGYRLDAELQEIEIGCKETKTRKITNFWLKKIRE